MRYNVFVAPSGITCASLAVALGGVFTQPIAVWRRSLGGSALESALAVAGVSRARRRGAMARARAETYVTYAVGSFLACVSRVRRARRARARRESRDVTRR